MAGTIENQGFAGLLFGPIRVQYGPKGTTTHFTVTCPYIGPLINYYNYIIGYGASGDFLGLDSGIDGVTSAFEKRLEVSIPGVVNNYNISELFFDQWELLANETTDSIFSNPLIVGSAGWMTANDKDVLSQLALNGGTIAQAVASANQNIPANAPHSTPTDARSKQLILEIMKGQVEYEKPSYVLRHTSYCSAGNYYNSSVSGSQMIYSPAQLLTEVGSGWTYNLPARLYSKISSIPYQYAPSNEASYYSWGWLKKIGREVQMANFMIEISTEYALGLWSNLRYQHY